MKSFTLLAFLFAFLILEGRAGAEEAAPAPTPDAKSESNAARAHEMDRIEQNFYDFWKLSLSSAPDYQAILRALERMDESVGAIRTEYPLATLEKPLQDLSSKIDRLKKAAGRKDLSLIRKGYDDLHQSCFQCHFTHDRPK